MIGRSEVTAIREVFCLSQRDLAKALNIAPLTVQRWESAKGPSPTGLQYEVMRALHGVAIEIQRRKDPLLGRMVGCRVALGIGALLAVALQQAMESLR